MVCKFDITERLNTAGNNVTLKQYEFFLRK